LRRETVRVRHIETHQQFAKPVTSCVLEGDGDPVRRMPRLLQLAWRLGLSMGLAAGIVQVLFALWRPPSRTAAAPA
jgi:hypothetical protein